MTGCCADCGQSFSAQLRHSARGLCERCYNRHRGAGTLAGFGSGRDFPAADKSWHVDALCAEVDPEIFFPEKGQSPREAKSICRACLVRAECLDYALETGPHQGIWGGLTERSRRVLSGELADSEEASAA